MAFFMKKTFCSVLLVAAFAGCTTTIKPQPLALGPYSVPQKNVTITDRDRGAYVALKPKGTLTVQLEANTGAGYRWKLARPFDSNVLQRVSPAEEPLPPIALAPTNINTRPQPEQWVFKAVGPGTSTVRLVYSRFDRPLADDLTFEFTVNAE
jgi:predicted secreted protein